MCDAALHGAGALCGRLGLRALLETGLLGRPRGESVGPGARGAGGSMGSGHGAVAGGPGRALEHGAAAGRTDGPRQRTCSPPLGVRGSGGSGGPRPRPRARPRLPTAASVTPPPRSPPPTSRLLDDRKAAPANEPEVHGPNRCYAPILSPFSPSPQAPSPPAVTCLSPVPVGPFSFSSLGFFCSLNPAGK